MLWNASAMNGYKVAAVDGEPGTVSDFIFEDVNWSIQWLVIETGTLLSGHKVFVPVSAFGNPDPETKTFSLDLTMHEIEKYPSGDVNQLRDFETGAHFTHGQDRVDSTDHSGGHFRSLAEITKVTVEPTDGDVGHAEDFLINTDGWQVSYLVVHTSSWLPGEKLVVSPLSIKGIDYTRSILNLDVTRQFVKDSPAYTTEQSVDGAFEETFNTYYGIRFGKK